MPPAAPLGMLVLLLALQVAAASPAAPSPADSARVAGEARREVRAFLLAWRELWLAGFSSAGTSADRLSAIHCHDEASQWGRPPMLISTTASRKSYCPGWYPDTLVKPSSERDIPDAPLDLRARGAVQERRATLVAQLRVASAALPGDTMIAGQLVRFLADQGDGAGAIEAAEQCQVGRGWCGLLRGWALHRAGRFAEADAAFTRALTAMDPAARCRWSDISALVPPRERNDWNAMDCARRLEVARVYWWLADPLYTTGGNARRAEHHARLVLAELRAAPEVDERIDWRRRYAGDAAAEMYVRYGQPDWWEWGGMQTDVGHFQWLGWRDESINAAPEYFLPRLRLGAEWRAVNDPMSLEAGDYELLPARRGSALDPSWAPHEHMPPDAGMLLPLDGQLSVLRRDGGLQLVGAYRVPDAMWGMQAALHVAQSRGPDSTRTMTRPGGAARYQPAGAPVTAAAVRIAPVDAIVSVELVGADPSRQVAARHRAAVTGIRALGDLPALDVSLPLLLLPDAGTTPIATLDSVLPLVSPTTELAGPRRVAVYWETYGLPPDGGGEFGLRVVRLDTPGLLRRIGASLRLADRGDADLSVRWQESRPGPGTVVTTDGAWAIQQRTLTFDLGSLPAGRYALELSVRADGATATSVREFAIRR
jgi:tetratricopeptide (TPR) repeat protein